MYNPPDPFKEILRAIEEAGDPFAPAPTPGSGNQPKCEEAQAFDSVAAGAAELLKSQQAMQAYPYDYEAAQNAVFARRDPDANETVVFSDGRVLRRATLNCLESDLLEAHRKIDLLRAEVTRLEMTVETQTDRTRYSLDPQQMPNSDLPVLQQVRTKDGPTTLHVEWRGIKLQLTTG